MQYKMPFGAHMLICSLEDMAIQAMLRAMHSLCVPYGMQLSPLREKIAAVHTVPSERPSHDI